MGTAGSPKTPSQALTYISEKEDPNSNKLAGLLSTYRRQRDVDLIFYQVNTHKHSESPAYFDEARSPHQELTSKFESPK
jgi:hypothetical protein